MKNNTVRNIVLFTSAVIASGWLGVLVDSVLPPQPQGNSLGMGVWLVLPLLTALLIALFSRTGWRELGLSTNFRGNMWWYWAAFMIFPVVTLIVLSLGSAANWIDLSRFDYQTAAAAFCSTLLVNFIIDFFEEAAWRGYLTTQIVKLNLSDWKIYLIVGCIWGLWHVPYYLVFLPETDISTVMPVSRAMYTIVAMTTFMCWAVMFVEIFRVTKSIWPCVILHIVEDSLVNMIVISGYIDIETGKEILVSPINGLAASLLYVTVGLAIRAYRIRSAPISAINEPQVSYERLTTCS